MPEATTNGQAWANELGEAFLDSRNKAECPDAVRYPFYYLESFSLGGKGELVVNVDSRMKNVAWGDSDIDSVTDFDYLAFGALDDLADEHSYLTRVTVRMENDQRSTSFDLAELEHESGPSGVLKARY